MKIIDKVFSEDKLSAKVLQATDDNFVIETGVFDDGNTCHLCVSCQIGCPISCQMCYNVQHFMAHFEQAKNVP